MLDTDRPVTRRRMLATILSLLCAPIFAASAATPSPPTGTSLHLVQRFEVAVGTRRPAITEDHQLYVDGNKLAMRSAKSWLLVRQDLQAAWIMNADRQMLSKVPLSRLGATAAAMNSIVPSVPPFRSTGESKTIVGLACRIYRGELKEISVEACLTRELKTLERFQSFLGMRPETPGIPLELIVTIREPQKERVTITQRITRVNPGPIDHAVFAPPAERPLPPARQ